MPWLYNRPTADHTPQGAGQLERQAKYLGRLVASTRHDEKPLPEKKRVVSWMLSIAKALKHIEKR
jgi:hypothetical protein